MLPYLVRAFTVIECMYALNESQVMLSALDACNYLNRSVTTVKRQCHSGVIKAETVRANGGIQYRIPLSSLPEQAQAAYYRKHYKQLTARELAEQAIANNHPAPLTPEQSHDLWEKHLRAPSRIQIEAKKRMAIVCQVVDLEKTGMPKMEIYKCLQQQHGVSEATLVRWQHKIRHVDRFDWAPTLAPAWKGKPPPAEFSEAAFAWIKTEWRTQSQPFLSDVYNRCKPVAEARGWVLPSMNTVRRRIDALPETWKVLTRQGEKALAATYPAQERDYSKLALHDLWNSDGHKADVFCRFEDGTVGRPIIVAWQDLRSRVCLGFEMGKVESADLVRYALRKAIKSSKALPREALLDNGRAFAGKLLTGGQPNRYRFKVKEEDVTGILTLFGISVIWATPGHGQAKPIERFWGTIAQVAKQAQFVGAYCGNKPDAKPEEFDARKAVPIALYRAAVAAAIEAYNNTAHRGDSMDLKSPRAMYEELAQSTPIRQPTEAQLHLCLLAAESVRLGKDHSVTILGNRYWVEALTALPRDANYTARFNPENAADPIAIYDGETFICDAPLVAKTGFRDQEAAKEHSRARKTHIKSIKQAHKSMAEVDKALLWGTGTTPKPDPATGEILPVPKVAEPLRPIKNYQKPKAALVMHGDDELSMEEFNEARARTEKIRYG